tara:strand:- start:72254 stop:72919 length:666 start_codon:yes stop_codon:yes gene_type:complete
MKKYPSIEYWNKGIFGSHCYAFDKLDGSNIRVEWDKKLSKKSTSTYGFGKFGTRNQMINHVNNNFGDSVDLFMNKYSVELDEIFRTDKLYRNSKVITVFLEYFGKNSFAGFHEKTDKKDIVLFDVMRFQKGFVSPSKFINDFGHLGIPSVVWEGEYTEELVEKVRNNDMPKHLIEGVVCKGSHEQKIWMAKVKTNAWLSQIKDKLGHQALLKELNGDKELL